MNFALFGEAYRSGFFNVRERWGDYCMEQYYETCGREAPSWLDFVAYFCGQVVAVVRCAFFGHRLDCESYIGPDSGSETLFCLRCGWSKDITWY